MKICTLICAACAFLLGSISSVLASSGAYGGEPTSLRTQHTLAEFKSQRSEREVHNPRLVCRSHPKHRQNNQQVLSQLPQVVQHSPRTEEKKAVAKPSTQASVGNTVSDVRHAFETKPYLLATPKRVPLTKHPVMKAIALTEQEIAILHPPTARQVKKSAHQSLRSFEHPEIVIKRSKEPVSEKKTDQSQASSSKITNPETRPNYPDFKKGLNIRTYVQERASSYLNTLQPAQQKILGLTGPSMSKREIELFMRQIYWQHVSYSFEEWRPLIEGFEGKGLNCKDRAHKLAGLINDPNIEFVVGSLTKDLKITKHPHSPYRPYIITHAWLIWTDPETGERWNADPLLHTSLVKEEKAREKGYVPFYIVDKNVIEGITIIDQQRFTITERKNKRASILLAKASSSSRY